jgi:hypothetical protein
MSWLALLSAPWGDMAPSGTLVCASQTQSRPLQRMLVCSLTTGLIRDTQVTGIVLVWHNAVIWTAKPNMKPTSSTRFSYAPVITNSLLIVAKTIVIMPLYSPKLNLIVETRYRKAIVRIFIFLHILSIERRETFIFRNI